MNKWGLAEKQQRQSLSKNGVPSESLLLTTEGKSSKDNASVREEVEALVRGERLSLSPRLALPLQDLHTDNSPFPL